MSKAADLYEVGAAPGAAAGTARVEVGRLRPGPRLRLDGIQRDHVYSLAQAAGNWPPILVRRDNNTIIDGFYRYLAARHLGYTHIDCVYFDGGPESAFLEALRRNIAHGLPLSVRERESAARRLLAFHQEWSDRRVGALCGLAPGTVAKLRCEAGLPASGSAHLTAVGEDGEGSRSGAQNGQLDVRVGRDGKRYPADPATARERILASLREDQNQSLRSIAKATGTSPATVRAVKAQLSVAGAAGGGQPLPGSAPAPAPERRVAKFLRWFERTRMTDEWRDLAAEIPAGKVGKIADEARQRARQWADFASTLEARKGAS
jgi:ParB-like chromosome segregation protein Spo0J